MDISQSFFITYYRCLNTSYRTRQNAGSFVLCTTPYPSNATRTSVTLWRSAPKLNTTLVSQPPPIKATAAAAAMANDTSTVDYSSTASVFPAEACETIGGEACDAEIYPEAKLNRGQKCHKSCRNSTNYNLSVNVTVCSQERLVMILVENSVNPITRKGSTRRTYCRSF
ncbi:hypothetical protein HHK36_007640 [Tetracentron sinense]|uniref:Uncharacterized protein n=1 Tax=Tetracentron sinense TaxID=13715 RepID=A0A834ZJA3_TETSI|nr:hypothetical protein HHK36_007640 [Tetracentron sinense]